MWNVITLDGCFQGKEPWDLRFHELVWGEYLEQFSIAQLDSAEAIVYGGVTYEGMASYWRGEQGEVSDRMNDIKKYVCSTALETVDWNNTEILRDAVSEIAALKQDGEGKLFVFGSGKLSNSLIKAGLFDEYRLCIAPVILGEGRRLFEDGLPTQNLSLISSEVFTKNAVLVKYGVRSIK